MRGSARQSSYSRPPRLGEAQLTETLLDRAAASRSNVGAGGLQFHDVAVHIVADGEILT